MRKEGLNDVVSYIFITLVHWLKESKMHTEALPVKAHQMMQFCHFTGGKWDKNTRMK